MKIKPLYDRINATGVFKEVRIVSEIPAVSRVKEAELPSAYLLPVEMFGDGSEGDITPQQQATFVYAVCVIAAPTPPDGSAEPLADAVEAVRRALFGALPAPDMAPLLLRDGSLSEYTTRAASWTETFISRQTYRA